MVQQIGEHSVDVDLLVRDHPNYPFILDLGCRGYEFINGIKGNNNFYTVDIDEFEGNHFRIGISNKNGYCSITGEGQATKITEGNDIPMMTLDMFSKMVGVKKWDLIKMDIEGEEVKVLRSLKHPYCKQISVEFHAHCGQTKKELDNLLDWLSEWYTIHNRVWEQRHCAGYNYWDILLIAK